MAGSVVCGETVGCYGLASEYSIAHRYSWLEVHVFVEEPPSFAIGSRYQQRYVEATRGVARLLGR